LSLWIARLILVVGLTSTFLRPAGVAPINLLDSCLILIANLTLLLVFFSRHFAAWCTAARMETASLSDGPIDPELLLLLRQVQKTNAGSNSNTGILIDEDDPEEVDNTDAWSDEIFVEEIRNYRCLWDTSCRAYKDGSKKQQSWRELSQKFKREGIYILQHALNIFAIFL